MLKKVKKYEEAIKCFEKIVNIDKNFLKAYNNIGTISLEVGKIKNAISNYKKVLKLDPHNFVSYKNFVTKFSDDFNIARDMTKIYNKYICVNLRPC